MIPIRKGYITHHTMRYLAVTALNCSHRPPERTLRRINVQTFGNGEAVGAPLPCTPGGLEQPSPPVAPNGFSSAKRVQAQTFFCSNPLFQSDFWIAGQGTTRALYLKCKARGWRTPPRLSGARGPPIRGRKHGVAPCDTPAPLREPVSFCGNPILIFNPVDDARRRQVRCISVPSITGSSSQSW